MTTPTLRTTAAILTAGVVLALSGCSDDAPQTADPAEVVVDTTAPPAELTWQSWRGADLPFSAVDGPSTVDGDVATGYSASPQGAVLAAAQSITRLRLAPDQSWPAVANALVAPGPGRDTYAVNRAQITITEPSPAGSEPDLAAFRVDDYSDTAATVELVTDTAGQLVATTHTLTWNGQDWVLVLPEATDDAAGPAVVDDLGGYTTWDRA